MSKASADDLDPIPVIETKGVRKAFRSGAEKIVVLDGLDFSIVPGESVAILGASGAGKSTLLQLLGGLDRPSDGKVLWSGQDVYRMGEAKRGAVRNCTLGFVYQFHHLLPEFTALENVALPAVIGGATPEEANKRASALLDDIGLGNRIGHKPSELSGGEKQRVAIARALSSQPACILGDEPTGNLDRNNADRVFGQLLELSTHTKVALALVTHDEDRAAHMSKCYRLESGRLHLC